MHRSSLSEHVRAQKWFYSAAALTDGYLAYNAKHLGTLEVNAAKGVEVVKDCIKKIKINRQLQKAEVGHKGSRPPKVEICISMKYVKIIDKKTKMVIANLSLHRISYCADDHSYKRIFAFIARDQETRKYNCFVFVTEKEASELTNTLGQAFQMAYEHHLQKNKHEIKKSEEVVDLTKQIEEIKAENERLKENLKRVRAQDSPPAYEKDSEVPVLDLDEFSMSWSGDGSDGNNLSRSFSPPPPYSTAGVVARHFSGPSIASVDADTRGPWTPPELDPSDPFEVLSMNIISDGGWPTRSATDIPANPHALVSMDPFPALPDTFEGLTGTLGAGLTSQSLKENQSSPESSLRFGNPFRKDSQSSDEVFPCSPTWKNDVGTKSSLSVETYQPLSTSIFDATTWGVIDIPADPFIELAEMRSNGMVSVRPVDDPVTNEHVVSRGMFATEDDNQVLPDSYVEILTKPNIGTFSDLNESFADLSLEVNNNIEWPSENSYGNVNSDVAYPHSDVNADGVIQQPSGSRVTAATARSLSSSHEPGLQALPPPPNKQTIKALSMIRQQEAARELEEATVRKRKASLRNRETLLLGSSLTASETVSGTVPETVSGQTKGKTVEVPIPRNASGGRTHRISLHEMPGTVDAARVGGRTRAKLSFDSAAHYHMQDTRQVSKNQVMQSIAETSKSLEYNDRPASEQSRSASRSRNPFQPSPPMERKTGDLRCDALSYLKSAGVLVDVADAFGTVPFDAADWRRS